MANILILEDDDALGTLLTRMLERVGHSVLHCTSGSVALEKLTEDTLTF